MRFNALFLFSFILGVVSFSPSQSRADPVTDGVFREVKNYSGEVRSWSDVLRAIRSTWGIKATELSPYLGIDSERVQIFFTGTPGGRTDPIRRGEVALIIQFLILYEPTRFAESLSRSQSVHALFAAEVTTPGLKPISVLRTLRAAHRFESEKLGEYPSFPTAYERDREKRSDLPFLVRRRLEEMTELLKRFGTEELAERSLRYAASRSNVSHETVKEFVNNPLTHPLTQRQLSKLYSTDVYDYLTRADHELTVTPQESAIFQARMAQKAEELLDRQQIAIAISQKFARSDSLVYPPAGKDARPDPDPSPAEIAANVAKLARLSTQIQNPPSGESGKFDISLLLTKTQLALLAQLLQRLESPSTGCASASRPQ